jgi:hypothetical protein
MCFVCSDEVAYALSLIEQAGFKYRLLILAGGGRVFKAMSLGVQALLAHAHAGEARTPPMSRFYS